ncbi:CubicO group peptidase, beta-lactamase class C family [Thalassobacillus cyri]|uniref:CubicO group peptidase, beta-lactamase class C family n=1 Tax=Thalassobacillus cyri TaxID=571932 RepID=A0A1H3X276_9BACI|nr:serine hydrolase domain-containing protein [Thalassobacillus cyri]SDZ93350.1 CubicO group peptidase, beta-lactamase class C family [Thalassobacillus cyri]
MKKKSMKLALVTVLGASMFTGYGVHAENNVPPEPTIEQTDKKNSQRSAHPVFSWNNPGPVSPVLHPGSVRGAGMVQAPLEAINSLMESKIEEGVMPGAVTFVARRGHIVQHEAYGHAALYEDDQGTVMDQPVAMKKDTIFDMASISKVFTTTAAMQLYEEGLFNLDDPVAEHIPEFAANEKEEVTIRQLMTHTSGFTPWVPIYTQEGDREDRLQYVLERPLANEPGTTYTYSDLNMITLSVLIERLSGQRLDKYVKVNITEPLGMEDTMYNPPASLKDRIAATEYQPWTDRGIVWGEVHDENAWSLDGVAGHAGVFSTARDLATFAHMYLNDGTYGGTQILKPETVKLLAENQIPQFPGDEHGLGWELQQGWYMDALSGSSTLGHTGYTGTSIAVSQNNDTIAVLLTNRVHPTRETVSTNVARRPFARLVADAIPVTIPNKEDAWFAGYGDRLNRALTAEVELDSEAILTFDTWHRIEAGYDKGFIEVTTDGENWEQVGEVLTGNKDWHQLEINLPADTRQVRFRYQTDSYTNGRGWYVNDLELKLANGSVQTPEFSGEGWELRNY